MIVLSPWLKYDCSGLDIVSGTTNVAYGKFIAGTQLNKKPLLHLVQLTYGKKLWRAKFFGTMLALLPIAEDQYLIRSIVRQMLDLQEELETIKQIIDGLLSKGSFVLTQTMEEFEKYQLLM